MVVLDEKNLHIRNIRDGTMIKMDVNNGVCTTDMWICLDETGPVFQLAGTVSGHTAFDKLVRRATMCRGEKAENRKLEEVEGTELNGVGEGEDGVSDEEGDRIFGQEKVAPPDWRVKAGLRNIPTQKEREGDEATHVSFRDWCTHCMMSRGRSHDHVTEQRATIGREAPLLR